MSELRLDHDPEGARACAEQQLLFPTSPRTLCDELGLEWWALLKLRDDGWLSFDPEATVLLNEAQDAELRFLAALVTAGCDPAILRKLLSGLAKPYSYHIGRLYYDWCGRGWRLLPQRSLKPAEVFSKWLAELKEAGEVEALQELAAEIEDVLTQLGALKPGSSVE